MTKGSSFKKKNLSVPSNIPATQTYGKPSLILDPVNGTVEAPMWLQKRKPQLVNQ
jgi:hypothetical protein